MAPRLNNVVCGGLVALALSGQSFAGSSPGVRLAAAPGYRGREVCPAACRQTGATSSSWSLYHNLDQITSCDQPLWYDFSLLDPVDDPTKPHRIYACTNSGMDWNHATANKTGADARLSANTTSGTYQIGYTPKTDSSPVAADISTLSPPIQDYFGSVPPDQDTLLFASVGTTSVGIYVGKGLQSQTIGDFALKYLLDAILSSELTSFSNLAMQYCDPHSTADHIFGFIVTGDKSFGTIQAALSSWSNASCLSLPETGTNVTGPIIFTTPVYLNHKSNLMTNNSTFSSVSPTTQSGRRLSVRSDCSTVEVVSGDSCASLVQKCGISASDFTQYNPQSNLCATLTPYQHVCCSSGTLPDFAPQQNADHSCYSYKVVTNDNCANLAAKYSLTNDLIEGYNQDTWGWNGCCNLFTGTVICLSPGNPPMPAAVANAVCGPQKPGTPNASSGTDISLLNPCPLNACCTIWGQCGITDEFCTNTNTGAPGTAKPGQNGCISNCGTEIVKGEPPATYKKIAFFEGFNLDRPCLYQTPGQVDTSAYTHLMFSFGLLDTSYNVQVGHTSNDFMFKEFKEADGIKKIFSIGGWAFSTDPSTYAIFRNGVTAANRQSMANKIANFVKFNDLDGVNIDWEYPGAPDIPGIPAASVEDGANYLEFLKLLRAQLPDSEISVCAPASYWYLQGFPITDMTTVLDYVVLMTYDLHGQWDANNKWAQEGCPSGSCLRSDVNLTETTQALAMVTKAGVPSNKIIVGVTSYGRSFAMSDANCYGPECTFLGTPGSSPATPGECTQTAGYIANAEINAILQNSSRVNQHYVDTTSNSNILVYDNTQWVGYMDDDTKSSRSQLYQNWAMGGLTDWAVDLQQYNDPPARSSSWLQFTSKVKSGGDPADIGGRTGNWSSLSCTDPSVTDIRDLSPQERWAEMDGSNAWSDLINIWETIDKPAGSLSFSESISDTIHGPEDAHCGLIGGSDCASTLLCLQGEGSGPAGYEIWNSFVYINGMYTNYWNALNGAAATQLGSSLAQFETTFAPVPPPKSDEWEQILIAVVTLGAGAIAAPFFNSIFKNLPIWKENPNTLGIIKDETSALITYGSNYAKDLVQPGSGGSWTIEDQQDFSTYLGQAIFGWTNLTAVTLSSLFDGTDSSISTLSKLIGNGNFIEGNDGEPDVTPDSSTITDLENTVLQAFYAFAIPSLWSVAGYAPFILSSGEPCDATYDKKNPDPVLQFVAQGAYASRACWKDDTYYYLVSFQGNWKSKSRFEAPAGWDSLASDQGQSTPWGGVTVQDIIFGSIRSYESNGDQNGAPVADPSNSQTISDLMNADVTTPGYIRLPVCNAAMAMAAWQNPDGYDTTSPSYPCVPFQGFTYCQDYTFANRTSDASPLVTDCQIIIDNIQNTNGSWFTDESTTRRLVTFGTCNFDVREKTSDDNGNAGYSVGSRDIINIINQSINMYASNGKVGATGTLACYGFVSEQPGVIWGLY